MEIQQKPANSIAQLKIPCSVENCEAYPSHMMYFVHSFSTTLAKIQLSMSNRCMYYSHLGSKITDLIDATDNLEYNVNNNYFGTLGIQTAVTVTLLSN